MKRILSSPVTHFNVLIIGFFILIGVMHNDYHHRMDEDVHGYVRKFCEKNPEKCQDILEGDDYQVVINTQVGLTPYLFCYIICKDLQHSVT